MSQSNVVRLIPPTPPKERATLCPQHLPLKDLERFLTIGMKKGRTFDELVFAWDQIRGWSKDKNAKVVDWVDTAHRYIARGWPLAGFKAEMARLGKSYPGRTIKPEKIGEYLMVLHKQGRR